MMCSECVHNVEGVQSLRMYIFITFEGGKCVCHIMSYREYNKIN